MILNEIKPPSYFCFIFRRILRIEYHDITKRSPSASLRDFARGAARSGRPRTREGKQLHTGTGNIYLTRKKKKKRPQSKFKRNAFFLSRKRAHALFRSRNRKLNYFFITSFDRTRIISQVAIERQKAFLFTRFLWP